MPAYPHTFAVNTLVVSAVLMMTPALIGLGCQWGGYHDLSRFFNGLGILLLTPLGCSLGGGVLGYFLACYLAGIARDPNGGDPRVVQTSIMVGLPLWCAGLGGVIGFMVDVGLLIKWW